MNETERPIQVHDTRIVADAWGGKCLKILRTWKGSACGKGYLDVFSGGWMQFIAEPVQYNEGDDSIENYMVQGFYHHARKPSEMGSEERDAASALGWVPLLIFVDGPQVAEILRGNGERNQVASERTVKTLGVETWHPAKMPARTWTTGSWTRAQSKGGTLRWNKEPSGPVEQKKVSWFASGSHEV